MKNQPNPLPCGKNEEIARFYCQAKKSQGTCSFTEASKILDFTRVYSDPEEYDNALEDVMKSVFAERRRGRPCFFAI